MLPGEDREPSCDIATQPTSALIVTPLGTPEFNGDEGEPQGHRPNLFASRVLEGNRTRVRCVLLAVVAAGIVINLIGIVAILALLNDTITAVCDGTGYRLTLPIAHGACLQAIITDLQILVAIIAGLGTILDPIATIAHLAGDGLALFVANLAGLLAVRTNLK